MNPKRAIELIEDQIKKGNELLEGKFSEGQYGAWENSTKHILMRIFGSDSPHIDDIMLYNRAGVSARNEVESLIMRSVRLTEQLELLESPKEQLLIDLTLEEDVEETPLQNTNTEFETEDNYNPTVTINIKKLINLMIEIFSKDELRDLCHELEKDPETFKQDTKPNMVNSMVSHYKRRKNIQRLFIEALLERQDDKKRFLDCIE